jgi:hypothetical protein
MLTDEVIPDEIGNSWTPYIFGVRGVFYWPLHAFN